MTEPLIISGESPDSLIRCQLIFDSRKIGREDWTKEQTMTYLKERYGQYPEKLAKLIFFPITMSACNPEIARILIENMEKHFEIMEDEIRAIIYAADCGRECEKDQN